MSQDQKRQVLQEFMQAESDKLFDLSADVLLRTAVFTLKEDRHLLIYSTHHIASDGWSMTTLKNELLHFYTRSAAGENSDLAPLAVQYADFSVWQRSWLRGDVLQTQLDYWFKQLANLPVKHSLPMDFARPEKMSYSGAMLQDVVDTALLTRVRALSQQHEVTVFMFLETVFAVLLGRYSGDDDIVLGSPISGRIHKELEPLIGFFVNTLVLRTQLSGNPTFSELLKVNKRVLLDAYENQHVPFERLVEKLSPERHHNHNPLFQVVFSVQAIGESDGPFSDNAIPMDDLALASDEEESGGFTGFDKPIKTRFDLEVNVFESSERLLIHWTFNQSLFTVSTVSRLARNFNSLLGAVVDMLSSSQLDEVGVRALAFISPKKAPARWIHGPVLQTIPPSLRC